ncbi:hypothetical protein [Spirosoma terrae]|uniref:Putative endonuclease SegE-like GIY-YIG domain-containing protein n=1 Tax=Spirosoma terrae TaxID=1968276 RepID=A0A6L9LB34_9BACT|nr:hypothetical protein [Spirosoma terrae]NDU95658.1 hypothetical protein [Spirosoma terrae]
MTWLYNRQPIEELPSEAFGFVYLIEHLPSKRRYIGRKNKTSVKTKKMTKADLAAQKLTCPRCRKTKMKVSSESDWRTYFGSNQTLKELVKQEPTAHFRRTILELAHGPKHLTYLEMKHIFAHNALEDPRYFNDNIQGSIFQRDLVPHKHGAEAEAGV